MASPIPPLRRLAYALGQAGYMLTDRIVVVVAVYFYLPPPGRGLEPQISQEVFIGILTVYGLASLVGRVFDSLADPFVGHASDRSRSPLGRRRAFLVAGVGPMVLAPVLLFFPPGAAGSAVNAAWLVVWNVVYFVSFTVYVAPYLALIPEIAPTQDGRVSLGRLLALVTWPVFVVFGMAWPAGLELGRSLGLDSADAMRAVVVVASLLALALCLAPVAAVDERRFGSPTPSALPLRRAVLETLGDRAFVLYLGAQLLFIFGSTVIQPAFPYIATVVLGRSEGFAVWFALPIGAGVLVAFATLDGLVRRRGPKRALIACVAVLGVALAPLGLLVPDAPGGPRDAWNLAIAFGASALLGLPVVGFFVLPHVLISQLVDRDARRGGASRAAMYYGMQGLLTKWMYGVAAGAFTFLLSRFGNSPEQPWGVVLVGPVAAGACLLSMLLYALYPEREVLAGASVGAAREEARA